MRQQFKRETGLADSFTELYAAGAPNVAARATGMLLLDVVDERIVYVEVLNRPKPESP